MWGNENTMHKQEGTDNQHIFSPVFGCLHPFKKTSKQRKLWQSMCK